MADCDTIVIAAEIEALEKIVASHQQMRWRSVVVSTDVLAGILSSLKAKDRLISIAQFRAERAIKLAKGAQFCIEHDDKEGACDHLQQVQYLEGWEDD